MIALSQGCPQLSSLDLSGCNQITDACVIALSQGCPQLSSLNLYDCEQITDAGVAALLQGCPDLKFRDFRDIAGDQCLQVMIERNPEMTELDLGGLQYRSRTRCVIALSQGCPQLSSLNLSGCDTDHGRVCDRVVARVPPALLSGSL